MISCSTSGRTSVLRAAPGEDPVDMEEWSTVEKGRLIHCSANSTGAAIVGAVMFSQLEG